jgi:ATP-dependent DNA helicase PIF1
MIVWDEAPMSHRYALEAIDRTLRDLMDNDLPFGGKIMLLTGDFRQILPVVPRASDGQVIGACIKKSDLWHHFRTLRLEINMRVRSAGSQGGSAAIQEFSDFLLTIGEGRHAIHPSLGPTYFKLPSDFVLQHSADETDRDAIIKHVYADIRDRYLDHEYFHNRVILAPVIVDVTDINNDVMALLPGEEHVYRSIDSVEEEEGLDETLYQQELLNGMNPPGMPAHVLRLRVGAPIMLIRNINGEQGLCNGTRLQIRRLSHNCIDAQILTGARNGERVFIPRITLISEDERMPFKLRRRQFPVQVAFAMTINKAQGQSVGRLGIYLRQPVFSHGHMYVALSRCTTRSEIKAVISSAALEEPDGSYTKNIVFQEVINT